MDIALDRCSGECTCWRTGAAASWAARPPVLQGSALRPSVRSTLGLQFTGARSILVNRLRTWASK